MCELFALHIESARGRAPQRSAAWLAAGLVQLAGLSVLSLLALFALLSLGPDVWLGIEQAPRALEPSLLFSLARLLAAGALAIALGVHFQYAPALLIEHGGSLVAALFASSGMVARSGVLRSWLTSALAHALPVLVIAAAFTLQSAAAGRLSGLLIALLALPSVALSCALGQGMIVESYLAISAAPPVRAARELSSARASIPAFVCIGLILCGPLPVAVALLRPSELTTGSLPADASLLLDVVVDETAREPYLPDSALRMVIARDSVQVVASDGGGTGRLPLPPGAIERVRVALGARSEASLREQPGFAIEVWLANERYLTTIDDSGVRRDDSLERRFSRILPALPRFLLALCWVWLASWFVRVLPRQADLYFAADEVLFARAARRAWRWLLVPALLAPGIAVWALVH
jgi:hypothetical protein